MSRQPRQERCKSCGAAIRWCHTRAGKRIPIDPIPVDGGNIRVFDDDLAVVLLHDEQRGYHEAGVALHASHFATCPDAPAWRRRKVVRS